MSESTAKSPNKCKDFVFCELDIFDLEHKYKPRKEKEEHSEQLSLFDEQK